LVTPADITSAAEGMRGRVRVTPCEYSPQLSARWGVELYAKLENFQVTGSFKARGAFNKIASLSPQELSSGVVTASSGNHGQAVGWCGRDVGCEVRVFVPEDVDPSKRAAIEAWGAEVVLEGADCVDTENAARAYAERHKKAYVPPYNDPVVIAGQGTCGFEIASQLPEVDAVFVALGGGGLIAGIATYLRSVRPGVKMIGCSPANSPALHECMKAGRVVDVECLPTLSDATAGGVEEGAITVELCRELVDESLLVNEDEIADAMREYIDAHHQLIEGSAGVALAALKRERARFANQKVAVLICGGNIGRAKLLSVLNT
jgi:threonine dehydratase